MSSPRACARRTADSTARIDAVMMFGWTPTPNSVTRDGVVISTNAVPSEVPMMAYSRPAGEM
jgi:hypothetical protein